MKQEIENNERIESFLNGDMTAEEVSDFINRMARDPALASEVELHRQIREVITDGAYFHIRNELQAIHARRLRSSRRIRRYTGFGLGGLIIGTISIILLVESPKIGQDAGKNDQIVLLKQDSGNMEAPVQHLQLKLADAKSGMVRDSDSCLGKAPPVDRQKANIDSTCDVSQVSTSTGTAQTELKTVALENIKSVIRSDVIPESLPDQDPVIPDCRKIRITGSFAESESCNNKPTGSIVINRQSVSGGLPPYAFSLSQVNFRDTLHFTGLFPGSYTVFARDANNCVSRLGTAQIRSVDCTYQAVFAPERGEVWTVPVDPDRLGTLTIFTKTGMVVYSIKVSGNQETLWNGTTLSGQSLPMGLYPFEIRYSDGSNFTGSVTIVR